LRAEQKTPELVHEWSRTLFQKSCERNLHLASIRKLIRFQETYDELHEDIVIKAHHLLNTHGNPWTHHRHVYF